MLSTFYDQISQKNEPISDIFLKWMFFFVLFFVGDTLKASSRMTSCNGRHTQVISHFWGILQLSDSEKYCYTSAYLTNHIPAVMRGYI